MFPASGKVVPPSDARRGFSLVELLVVIGIIGVLVAILLPALSAATAYGRSVRCLSQMREVGLALSVYADENDGSYPRDETPWRPERVSWTAVVARGVGDADALDAATAGLPPLVPLRLRRLYMDEDALPVLHCPSHPRRGEVPGTYVMNAFDFLTEGRWQPTAMTKLARIQEPSRVVALAEASDSFGGGDLPDRTPANRVDWPEFHDVFDPRHLPGGSLVRLSDTVHRDGVNANLLRFDGSAAAVRRGDDGAARLRRRRDQPFGPARRRLPARVNRAR